MAFTFTPYYSGGWQSGEEGGTPITPASLNHYDDAFNDVSDAINVVKDFTDWDDFTPNSTTAAFRVGATSGGAGTHAPIEGDNATWHGMAFGVNSYFSQMLICTYANSSFNRGRVFTRVYVNDSFGVWMELMPEMPLMTITANSTGTFTMALYGACKLYICGYRTAAIGAYMLCRSTNSTLVTVPLGTAPANVNISMASTGVVTIQNNDVSPINVRIERFSGGVSV